MSHPYYTLEIPEIAGDDEIRRAYLEKIRRYPPESHPKEFQQINEAYEAIRNEEARAKLKLFGKLYHNRDLEDMAPTFRSNRRRPGVSPWLQAIKEHHGNRR